MVKPHGKVMYLLRQNSSLVLESQQTNKKHKQQQQQNPWEIIISEFYVTFSLQRNFC